MKHFLFLTFLLLTSCAHQQDTHGPDDNSPLIPIGFWQGNWILRAISKSDDPVALFHLFQDDQKISLTGSYLQFAYPYSPLDQQSGEILSSEGHPKKIILTWNPTNDSEEIWRFEGDVNPHPTFSRNEVIGTFCDRGKDLCFPALLAPTPPLPL
jgi:hypothetical protein